MRGCGNLRAFLFLEKYMEFLNEYNKDTKKMEGISTSAPGPRFWISTGNYIINKIISGKYKGGIGQGKMAALTGPSSAGKSFLAGNIIKAAQDMGCGVLIVDSENALDDPFMEAIGANPHDDYYVYRGVSTIQQGTAVVSSFLKSYRKHKETKPFLIVIDSLDAMITESAMSAYEDGIVKGDQGQQAKQLKTMLSPFMHEIKDLNVAMLCTKQVYKTQDPIEAKNPVTEWKLTEAIKYPFSQIMLVTRLMLKDDATKKYEGIRLKVFGLKTRFTKPFQSALIEVPYDKGMDPFAGVLEAAEALGVITRNGAWYTFNGQKFQSKNFASIQEQVLEELIRREDEVLEFKIEDAELYEGEEDVEPTGAEKTKAAIEKRSGKEE